MRSLVLGITAALCLTQARAGDLPIERLFDAPDLQGPSLRQMRFSPDGKLVSYLRGRDDAPAVFDLWAWDVSRKTHRLLVDSRALAPAEEKLSAEEEARRERQRIAALRGIVDYQWSPDSRGLLVPLSGDLYYYDLSKPAGEAVRRLTETAAFETDPKFSPRGRYVSFVRDQDLYAVEVATGAERRLTTGGGGLVSHGVAEFIAQEEMGRDTGYWWSPDEKHLAYARVDESPVDEVERFEIDADGVRVLKQRYPATGRPNAGVTLAILALDTGATAACDLGRKDGYLARVEWYPEGDRLLVQWQARDQKRLDVLSFAVTGGESRQLFSERSDTWVELNDDLYFLPERREILWASQRSGHNHLYRVRLRRRAEGPGDRGRLGRDRRMERAGGARHRRAARQGLLHGDEEDAARAAALRRRPRRRPAARARGADVGRRLEQRHDVRRRAAFPAGLQRSCAATAGLAARRLGRAARLAGREPDRREPSVRAVPRSPRAAGIRDPSGPGRHGAPLPALQAGGRRAGQALSRGAHRVRRPDGADRAAPLGRAARQPDGAALHATRLRRVRDRQPRLGRARQEIHRGAVPPARRRRGGGPARRASPGSSHGISWTRRGSASMAGATAAT